MSDYDSATDDLLKDVGEIIPLDLLNDSLIPAEWANDFNPFHPEPSDSNINEVNDLEEPESTSGGGVIPFSLQEHSASLLTVLNDVYLTAPISSGADGVDGNETMIIQDISRSLPEPAIDSYEETSQLQMMPTMNMHNSTSAGHVSGNSDNDSQMDVGPLNLTASAAAAAQVQAPLEATLEYTPPKPNRKRNSNSESSSTSSQNAATKVKGSKKTKMYENPDKSDPLVVRAEYAKTYRERKKEEKMNLSNQLSKAQDELNRSKEKNKQLERTTCEQTKQINNLKLEIKLKDDKIAELEDILKNEKDKNSLNPSQTREMVENFASVVDNFRSKGSRPMKLIVPERLAKKKAYALTHEEVQSTCDNLRMERSCTITFDLDEEKKRFIAKTK